VFRFDLPGHGGAPAHPASSVAGLGDRLLDTLDELGVQRFGYAGCGLGAAVGVDLALRHPERVATLALIAASPRFGTPDEFRQRGVVVRANGMEPMARAAPARWFAKPFAAAQPAIVEWAVEMVRTTDPGCYIGACEALATFDVRAALPDLVGLPTLVLVGAEDRVTGPAQARTLVAGIPDARLAVVPAAGHLTPIEQPMAVNDLLIRHLSDSWPNESGSTTGFTKIVIPPESTAPPAAPAARLALTAAPDPADPALPDGPDPYEAGMRVRRDVLGDAHVDRAVAAADDFTGDFEDFDTRYAWGAVWTRPGLDRRARSCVALTALVAGGHFDELAAHVRAALRNGLTPVEIKEVLLQAGVYCGLPAAGRAFAVAQAVIREETTLGD
jgi:3-oxoadipate enol-lactonase/4-carboxymuconolactone decarboxylase